MNRRKFLQLVGVAPVAAALPAAIATERQPPARGKAAVWAGDVTPTASNWLVIADEPRERAELKKILLEHSTSGFLVLPASVSFTVATV